MRNQRLLWCLGAGALLLLAGFAVFVVVRVLPDRITPVNCDLIAEGMTAGEVEAIFGRPADAEVGGPSEVFWSKQWPGERLAVGFDFDPRGRVRQMAWCVETETAEDAWWVLGLTAPTFWQKLRRSLGG